MTISLQEISAAQAGRIALRHVGHHAVEADRILSIKKGTTEDKRYPTYRIGSYQRCDACWIVMLGQRRTAPLLLDGSNTVVWVDQRTGAVMQCGTGGGG